MIEELIYKIKEARFIFICGNGGSASTAEHFTTDLVKNGYKAICLNSNQSLLTMIANDFGYEHIFRYQLGMFAKREDLLITISCSGTSNNITQAQDWARNRAVPVFEFPTFPDKEKHPYKDYALLEDEHLKLCHQVAIQLNND